MPWQCGLSRWGGNFNKNNLCRNSVKSTASNCIIAGFNIIDFLVSKSIGYGWQHLVGVSLIKVERRYVSVQVVLLLHHWLSLTKGKLMKGSWSMVMGTSQGVDWHFVDQKFTEPLANLYFCSSVSLYTTIWYVNIKTIESVCQVDEKDDYIVLGVQCHIRPKAECDTFEITWEGWPSFKRWE